jgi:hypothetical protein
MADSDKSAKEGKTVKVLSFGARLLGGEAAEEHASYVLRGMNRLWNKLVEIEHEARIAYNDALIQSDEELSKLKAEEEQKDLLVDSLIEKRNRDRASKRTKKIDQAENYAALIKKASAERKEIRARMKEIKGRAKEQAKPLIQKAEQERREKVKEAVAASGLWWCHSEMLVGPAGKFDAARVKAMKEGMKLQFHRYDGNGSMRVRLTNDGGELSRIMGGHTNLIKIRDPLPQELGTMKQTKSDGGQRKIIEIRSGSRNEDGSIPKLTFMVTIHGDREFPTDMPLKTVTLKREMHVDKPDWKMVFMFSREATENDNYQEMPQGAVGIDFGFRMVRDDDGETGLRVGCVSNGERFKHIVLPGSWMKRMKRADDLRGELDQLSNDFWTKIKPILVSAESAIDHLSEESAWFKAIAGKVLRAKLGYTSLLLSLCESHVSAGNPLGKEATKLMDDFYHEALKLSREVHHTRRKAIDHRKHIFRNVAAQIVRDAGMIALKNTDFRDLAKLEKDDGTENDLVQTARRNRTWGAPSELRLAIQQAAMREGRIVVLVPPEYKTRECSYCGHIHSQALIDLNHVCENCGKVYDQDENSAVNCRNFSIAQAENEGVARG